MSQKVYPKYRWYVLFALLVSVAIQGMVMICPSPIVGAIAESLKLDLGSATAAITLPFLLTIGVGGVLSGFIIDKFGLEKTFVVSTAIVVITGLLMPVFGKTMIGLIVLRGIQGLVFAPTTAAAGPKVAAEWFPPHERVMVPGLMNAAFSLGISVGFCVSPAIAAISGWNAAFTWMTLAMILSLILFVIQAFGPKAPGFTEENITAATSNDDFKKVFKIPVFWLTIVAFFMFPWVLQGYNNLMAGKLAVPTPVGLGLGAQVTGGIMSGFTIAGVIGSILSSLILEKIFRGKFKTGITVTFILTALFCVLVMLPGIYTNVVLLTGCVIMAGFFTGMPGPFIQGFISRHYPTHIMGRVGGITIGLGMFGGSVSVAVGSFALHATGYYTVPIILVIIAAIIGAIAGFGIIPAKVLENDKECAAVHEMSQL